MTVRILSQSPCPATLRLRESVSPCSERKRERPLEPPKEGELSDVQSARATERTDACHQGWGRGQLPIHRCRPGPSVPRSNMANAVSSPGPERPRASSEIPGLVTKSKWKSRKDTRRGLQTEAASTKAGTARASTLLLGPLPARGTERPVRLRDSSRATQLRVGHEGGPGSWLPQGRSPARHWRPQAIAGPPPPLPPPCRIPTAAEVLILREI